MTTPASARRCHLRALARVALALPLALLAVSPPAAATVLLDGSFIELPIDDISSVGRFMDSSNLQGAKYNPNGTGGASGTDFWVHGSPVYNYTIAVGGTTFRTNGFGWAVPPTVTDTSAGATNSAVVSGTPVAGLTFSRSISFDDADELIVIRDVLSNTGGAPLAQVATLDNTDPDQDLPGAGNFSTSNDVVSALATNDLVLATGPSSGLTIGFGSPSEVAVVAADASGFSNINPYPIIAAPTDPNGASADIGINLALDYGTLAPGESTAVVWCIVFGASKAAATATYSARCPRSSAADHFLCYKSGTTDGTPKPPDAHGVSLADQFAVVTARIAKPKLFCTPADKNGEGIGDSTVHLRTRRITATPPFVKRTGITVRNQFGDVKVDLIRRGELLIPSTKGSPGGAFPAPPDPLLHGVDHFQCYKARVTRGAPKFPKGVQVTVADQFTAPPKLFDVKKPRMLCNPVDKNGEGMKDERRHLMCYQVRPAAGEPAHVPQTGLPVTNQFTFERVDTKKEDWLCVPSEKFLGVPPTTSTSTSSTTSTSTSSTTSTSTSVTTTTSTSTSTTFLVEDHFRLYNAAGPDGPVVTLVDEFFGSTVDLGAATFFMPPVDKNGEGIRDPVTHQTCYPYGGSPLGAFVTVLNQFGSQTLEVGAPVALCVPTEKFPAPVPVPLPRDHFNCYQASGSPPGDLVSLVDQFQAQSPVEVGDPFLYCTPADKNAEGILNPDDHLTCYLTDPPGLPVGPVPVRNQFHAPVLDVFEPIALCVPSLQIRVNVGLLSIDRDGPQLHVIDPTDGSTLETLPISLPARTIIGGNGLATHPLTGELFALLRLSGQSGRQLVRINRLTGVATSVGNTGDNFAGLAFDAAGTLYGVTGDGGDSPETLFTLSTINATPTLVLPLGRGSDGETIAFNPDDGLIYHASGLGTKVFESIDPNSLVVTDIPLSGVLYGEATALTYEATGSLLLADLSDRLFRITTGGFVTAIGTMDHSSKGLAR